MAKRKEYGLTRELSVELDTDGLLSLRGTVEPEKKPIKAVLSRRAGTVLWYQLTKVLYPDAAIHITSIAGTAPLFSMDAPPLTSHMTVQKTDDGRYELIGRVMSGEWSIVIGANEARRLWANLDILLYPYGWQGRESYEADDTPAVQS